MKKIDLTGQKFNLLTVLYECKERQCNHIVWHCRCDCGNECDVLGSHLKSGHVKSCGCIKHNPKIKDLTNQHFGRLTAIKYLGNSIWECKCQCGKTINVKTSKLNSGHTKSCGCLQKEIASKNKFKDLTGQQFGRLKVLSLNRIENHNSIWNCECECGNTINVIGSNLTSGGTTSCGCSRIKDLTGQQFGLLTAIRPLKERNVSSVMWECKCKCGNIIKVSSNNLVQGFTSSCGCLNSKGEAKISQILKEYNILFEQQKTFNTCRFLDTNALARFDFYLPEQNVLIEYDGKQHFDYDENGWNTKDNFIKTQQHDQFKNQWCKENNIPLIRIPYLYFNNIESILRQELNI